MSTYQIQVATMAAILNENQKDAKYFFSKLAEAIDDGLGKGVGIIADHNFQFAADIYKEAEFRLCAYHVKKNMKKCTSKDKEIYQLMVDAPNKKQADMLWTKLSKVVCMFIRSFL
jgi:hypothetical protein